jgi:hypothetical protein
LEGDPHEEGSRVDLFGLILCWDNFLEYKILLFFGAAFLAFAGASALAVISGVLYRAPEGDERADGLHIRQRNRPKRFLLACSTGSAGFQEPRTHESLNSAR